MGFRKITRQEKLISRRYSGLSFEPHNSDCITTVMILHDNSLTIFFGDVRISSRLYVKWLWKVKTSLRASLLTAESQIMLWHLDMPRFTLIPEEQETQQQQSIVVTGER